MTYMRMDKLQNIYTATEIGNINDKKYRTEKITKSRSTHEENRNTYMAKINIYDMSDINV